MEAVDSSILVASLVETEPHHQASARLLARAGLLVPHNLLYAD